jgi:putative redox protein
VITVRLYAERKQWPVERVEVKLTREPATGVITDVAMNLSIDGRLDDAQRERLREIAGRCQVHRALTEGIRITHR